ncbi:PREDICTED: metacaspase-1-like isoform X2 [Camelina sativa]|nr:PREDICTED: metacaspase-1-like isoform X1 [Camelina sativa]XP_010496694.1 PREDICTED: metacaspase-1-like isoform X2 [Camelina sativa]
MTFCFIQAIERSTQGTTYGSILNSMRTTIRNTGNDGGGIGGSGVVTTVLSMLLTGGSAIGGLRQEPQLTACQPFDVYAKPFIL